MPSKLKTLVILTPGFPENEADTTCLPLQQTLLKSIKCDYPEMSIIILSFQYPFKQQRYNWHGMEVRAFGGKGRGKVFRVFNWLKVWRELKNINANHHVIGLFSFWMGECAFIGHWFSRFYNLKYHYWILGQDAKPGNVYFKMMRPNANEMVALSDFLVNAMRKNYNITPSYTIAGGLDISMFSGKVSGRPIDILSAGSLIPLKQYHLFIELVARVKKAYPNVNAVLCGDGPEKYNLMLMIKKLGLENNITLIGEVPHPEVLLLMQQAKVFFHPSNYEGLGMVMPEALYAGARIISFVKPFNREITNWYIVANNVVAAKLSIMILAQSDLEFTSVAPFLIADTAKAIIELYDNKLALTSRKRLAIALNESVA